MTTFLNDNQGWWGFLAVPLALAAALIPLWQVRQTATTNRLSERDRWRTLVAAMARNRSLTLRQRRGDFQLPVRLVDGAGETVPDPVADLAAHLTGGGCAEVLGEAGSGKSYLAVEVRAATLARNPSVVVDVVAAREWFTSRPKIGGPADARGLVEGASTILQKRYRIFRRAYLRRLLEEGRIILAVDGFDEVEEGQADELWQAILGHATTMPVLVLRRASSPLSTVTVERLSFYEFARFEVRPLGELPVARFLRGRFSWYDRLSEARRPHLLRRVLTNPLQLHLAAQTWSAAGPPAEILAAEDPAAVLWSTFIREKLDRSAPGRQDRRLRRVVQVLALSAGSPAGRLSEAFHDTRLRTWTILALAALVIPYGWVVGSPALAIVAVVAVAGGLRPYYARSVLGVPLRRLLAKSMALYFAAVTVLFAAAYVALQQYLFTPVHVLVDIVAEAVPRLGMTVPEVLSGTNALSVWWEFLPQLDWAGVVDPFILVVAVAALVYAYMVDLTSTDNDTLGLLLGWDRLPFRHHLWTRVVMAVVFLGPLTQFSVIFLVYGVGTLSTVLYASLRYLGMALYVGSPRCYSPEVLRRLEELGIVYESGGWFRFVHREIADNVALDVFRRGDHLVRHARMVESARSTEIVEALNRYQDVPLAEPLARRFLRQYAESAGLVSIASLLFTYGTSDLATARRAQRRLASGTTGAHLAETLWFMGEVEQARAVMARAVRQYPGTTFVLNRASRMLIALGDEDEGLRLLRDAVPHLDGPDRWFVETRIAVAESQLGRLSEEDALAALDRLSAGANPVRFSAIMETFRIWSELRGEHRRAAESLERWEQAGFGGIVSARLAQVHLRAGDHERSREYARRIMGELRWSTDPAAQLEAAVTASAATDDPLATQLVTRMTGYGWPVDGRLTTIADEMRASPHPD